MKRESRWWHRIYRPQHLHVLRQEPSPIADGRRAYDYVSRRTFMVCSIILSVVMVMTLASVVVIALVVNSIQQNEIQNNRDSIQRLDRVTGELRALTDPTPEQYRQQVADGLKRCAQEPACRNAIRSLTK